MNPPLKNNHLRFKSYITGNFLHILQMLFAHMHLIFVFPWTIFKLSLITLKHIYFELNNCFLYLLHVGITKLPRLIKFPFKSRQTSAISSPSSFSSHDPIISSKESPFRFNKAPAMFCLTLLYYYFKNLSFNFAFCFNLVSNPYWVWRWQRESKMILVWFKCSCIVMNKVTGFTSVHCRALCLTQIP